MGGAIVGLPREEGADADVTFFEKTIGGIADLPMESWSKERLRFDEDVT